MGLTQLKSSPPAKLIAGHDAGVVTVSVNVFVAVAPAPLKAVTVTAYDPAGWASVTRTTPVAGSISSWPLKLDDVETLILVVLAGAASGVIVLLVLSGIDVSG